MNLAELERKLIAAARAHPPSDHVPYAFERRIMARLGSRSAKDVAAFWAHSLWRAAGSCIAVVILLSALSFLSPADKSQDLSQELDNLVLAAVDLEGLN
jgi:hypothetical protein